MYIISITCQRFCISFFGYHFSLRGVIDRVWVFLIFFLYSYNIMYLQYNLCLSHGPDV